ncbi:PepSY domain-containing protein [Lysobacter sp. SG-8]|uniref:PepSY domain-containing protein n=1 Tax=Marilutibacter penaei TaxID=2759900 RepID=A0A7W3U510_9GAMM|nr:PepSY-associated TM helix domain-containing protein [Lysobacter penaei]MBB1088745.1 PepSY domain-containing protein [Lysobacter penaei]
MKIPAATLRRFTTVHTWTGLVAGFALFVAFYAGAITVFHHDLQLWESPQGLHAQAQTLDDAQRLLDETLARHPAARVHLGMVFPGHEYPVATSYWQEADGTWKFATLEDLEGSTQPIGGVLSELVNALHYSLGIPVAGTWLMGIVSLLYGVALFSGIVIHLPKLLADLFALRPGRNLKRFWQDAHNVIGVLGLPMHLMFAVTGALLCLMFLVMPALDALVYRGGLMPSLAGTMDTAPIVAPAGRAAPTGPMAMWHARSVEVARERGLADFEPAYLKLANAGDAHAIVEVTGASPGALGPLGSIALDASTGVLIADQLPGARDANHATLAAAYALHFGEYGNAWVPWLYFLLGLGGAFLFYSGNLLWIESRRKRRQATQDRAPWWMARMTAGFCIGSCVAISVAFCAVQLLQWPALGYTGSLATGVSVACFGSWALCLLWAAWRPPARAAIELLGVAAVATALVPVAHGLATGAWWWRSLSVGNGALFAIDAGALALAAGFAWLARVTGRRARSGEPNSVWAGMAARPG